MAEGQNLQPTKVIAQIFGVSTRRVEQLKTEGVIEGQGKPTKYDLLPTIKAYIKYLADKAYGREVKKTTAQLEESKLRAEVDIKAGAQRVTGEDAPSGGRGGHHDRPRPLSSVTSHGYAWKAGRRSGGDAHCIRTG